MQNFGPLGRRQLVTGHPACGAGGQLRRLGVAVAAGGGGPGHPGQSGRIPVWDLGGDEVVEAVHQRLEGGTSLSALSDNSSKRA